MNANYEYFMSRDLQRYSGDWVIIIKEKVIAHGPRRKMKEMLQQARKAYPKESLLIAKVPHGTEQIL